MVRGFKYRIYPTKGQKESLAKVFGCCRYVYNWALGMRTKAWKERGERVNYYQTNKALTQLRHSPETAWLSGSSAVAEQMALMSLQDSFSNFWDKNSNYPKFKEKRNKQSAKFVGNGFSLHSCRLMIVKVGVLKVRWSGRLLNEPTSVTISKTSSGKYYASFTVDEPLREMPAATKSIGIDVGIETFATTNEGSKYTAPRPLRKKMAQLKRAQKSLSRKKKGSKNREKQRIRVAIIHEKIANIRKDFIHKLTTKLVRENQTIVTEDLNVRDMMQNHKLAGSIGDQGWGEFFRQLDYKCRWYGRDYVKIDRFYPSSKMCSNCSHIVERLPLDKRTWKCEKCGTVHDRDVNAAKNILAAGYAVLACGDGVRPKRSKERKGNCRRSRNANFTNIGSSDRIVLVEEN
jgi:putative transposase